MPSPCSKDQGKIGSHHQERATQRDSASPKLQHNNMRATQTSTVDTSRLLTPAPTTSRVARLADRLSSSQLKPQLRTTWLHQQLSKTPSGMAHSVRQSRVTRRSKPPVNTVLANHSNRWASHPTAQSCQEPASTQHRRNQQRPPPTCNDLMPQET